MKRRKWQSTLSWVLTTAMLLGNFQGNVIASYAYEGDEEEVILGEEELDEEDEAEEAEDSEEAEVAEEAAEAEDEDTDEAEAEDSDAEAEDAYAEDDADDEEEVEAVKEEEFDIDSLPEKTTVESIYYGNDMRSWYDGIFGENATPDYWKNKKVFAVVLNCGKDIVADEHARGKYTWGIFSENDKWALSDGTLSENGFKTTGKLALIGPEELFDYLYPEHENGALIEFAPWSTASTADQNADYLPTDAWTGDVFYFNIDTTQNASYNSTASLNVEADADSVSFDEAEVGYDAVAGKKVTVVKAEKTALNVPVSVKLTDGTNFVLSEDITASFNKAADSTVSFNIQPKKGLEAGEYTDTISINSAHMSSAINIPVSFKVTSTATEPEAEYGISVNKVTVDAEIGEYTSENGIQFKEITLDETTEAPEAVVEIKNVSDDIAANVLAAKLSEGSVFTVIPEKADAVSKNETFEFVLSVSLDKITEAKLYEDVLTISGDGISVNEIKIPVSINVVEPKAPVVNYSVSVCSANNTVGTYTVDVSGNVTKFEFNKVAYDYSVSDLGVQFVVVNHSDVALSANDIKASVDSDKFTVTPDANAGEVAVSGNTTFTVSVDLAKAKDSGDHEGVLSFDVKGYDAPITVALVFTRDKAPAADISVSIDGVKVSGATKIDFGEIIKGGSFEPKVLEFLNAGDAEGAVYVNEVDADENVISQNKLLNISQVSANVASGNKVVSITVSAADVTTISVNKTILCITMGDTHYNIPVTYTVLNDNVTDVTVTPSENVVSINDIEVEEGYIAEYNKVFTLSNNSTEYTDKLKNVKVTVSGDDAGYFVLNENAFDEIMSGSSAKVTVGVKELLPAKKYTATITFSADNMADISRTVEFVVNQSDSMHFDVTGKGVSVNEAYNERLENTFNAKLGKEVSKNGAAYLIDLDGSTSVSGNEDSYDVEYRDGYFYTLSTNSLTVSEGKLSVSAGDAVSGAHFETVTFNFKYIVTFDANGGVFTVDCTGESLSDNATVMEVLVPVGGVISEARHFVDMPVAQKEGYGFIGWTLDGEEFDANASISADITVSANWHEHQYPASGSENSAYVVWHWGDVAEKYEGTWVEIFCCSENCVDREGSRIVVSGNDITISTNGVFYTCEKDGAVTATASANASSISRNYTAEQVSVNAAPGHNWKYVSENVVWAEDYSSATVERICQNIFHEGNASEIVSANSIDIEYIGEDCEAPGFHKYTATWLDENGEVVCVSVNTVSVDMLGHDYKESFTWTDNGYENVPSVEAKLTCARNPEHVVIISANQISVNLIGEDADHVVKTYEAGFTYDGTVYTSTHEVYSHTDHKWTVSFNWTGTVSYDGSAFNVTAVAVCGNGKETRDLELSLSYNDAKAQGIRIWTAEVIGIKGDASVDPDGLKALIGTSESRMVYAPDAVISPLYGDIVIVNLEEEYEFTGNKITPAFNIIDEERGEFLAKGVDYTVSYGANKEGTGTITVKGKGNYEGKNTTATFKIVDPRQNLSQEELQALADVKGWNVKADAVTYTGESIKPAVIQVKVKGSRSFVPYTLDDNGEDYYNGEEKLPAIVTFANNVNKGTARITLLGANNSIVKKSFKIKPVDLGVVAGDLEINVEDTVYAVKGATPEITVEYMGNLLIEGQDYKVSYDKKSFKKAGNSSLVITGKGNYTKKTNAVYFGIDQLDLGDIDPDSVALKFKAGTKAGKITATVLDWNGNALGKKQIKVGVYGMADSAALVAGEEYTVVITAADANLVLGSEIEVPITVGQDFAKVYAKADKKFAKEYTGEGVILDEEDFGAGRIDVRAGGKNGTPLTLGENFEIAGYTNNVKKGTMTVTLKGIGSYSGTKTVKVKIKAKKLAATN